MPEEYHTYSQPENVDDSLYMLLEHLDQLDLNKDLQQESKGTIICISNLILCQLVTT